MAVAPEDRLKVAVLISGRGSNMAALADAAAAPDYPARIVAVISNRPDAAGLALAAEHGLPTQVIDHQAFPDRTTFDAALTEAAETAGAEFICLAGFMRLFTTGFIDHWRDRLINIHPSLLPAFPGLNVHRKVLERGCRFSGCTVHFVRPDTDTGPIIAQAVVPVHPDDDAGALADRVLAAEHVLYPMALRLVAEGRVTIAGDIVRIDGAKAPAGAFFNPLPT